MKTVGIIGNGFVGNAIYQNFKKRTITKVFDVHPEKAVDSYVDVISSDIIFVCLPTPMTENGQCDVSYVYKFFDEVPQQTSGLFVIKSTVPIGTTEQLCSSRTDLRIIHNPEFLTAENAVTDFLHCERNIIGGNYVDCEELEEFLYEIFHEWQHIPCYLVSSKESETIKYFSNCFLALKIAYFNNVYETCQKFGLRYNEVRNAICEDIRIGYRHTDVPGSDGKLGFGGYCFPKDINALIHSLNEHGIDSQLLQATWDYNKILRNDLGVI
jgi:UDPglucose 6-dehydrogenase